MRSGIANIAVLAHIDAGKTTLSERLLFHGKSIDVMGEVEEGLSTLDYLAEERRRGITIEAGYAKFYFKDRTFNLIDTPGHIDFGVEVDAALSAIEAALLVISGVRGVQTQTLTHWRKLKSSRIPSLVFVNKMDQKSHQNLDILLEIETALEIKPIVLTLPYYQGEVLRGVLDLVHQKIIIPKSKDSREVLIQDFSEVDEIFAKPFRQELLEFCALYDDEVMTKFLSDEVITAEEILPILKLALAKLDYVPVLFGSAKISVGMRSLLNALRYLVPEFCAHSSDMGIFVKARYRSDIGLFYLFKALNSVNIPQAKWFDIHAEELDESVEPLPGELKALQVDGYFPLGSRYSMTQKINEACEINYRPLLKFTIETQDSEKYEALEQALQLIQKTDPSMFLQKDEETGLWELSVVGEVYLDVLKARLADEFNTPIQASAPQVRCIETLVKPIVFQMECTGPNGYYAVEFELSQGEESLGDQIILPQTYLQQEMLLHVIQSVLDEWKRQGLKSQGEISHLSITIKSLIAPDVILPVPIKKMLLDAVRLHTNWDSICLREPWVLLEIQSPSEASGLILDDLRKRHAQITDIVDKGLFLFIQGEIPLSQTFGYQTDLRSLSKGHASWNMEFLGYRKKL